MRYRNERHRELAIKLIAAKARSVDFLKDTQRISATLGVSVATVQNYIHGEIKDGYLGEDILALMTVAPADVRKLKPVKTRHDVKEMQFCCI
jgi:predicted transcriptional regulator